MIQISKTDIEIAYDVIAHGNPKAIGYRVMIYPLEATAELEKAQMKEFEALAKSGFIQKTEEQRARESKGTHHGIVVSVGEFAYQTDKLGSENWVNEGDVVIFDRYAGVEIELPPGSGQMFRFTNDESILGKVE